MRYIMLGRAREIYYLHCVRKHARKKIEKKKEVKLCLT